MSARSREAIIAIRKIVRAADNAARELSDRTGLTPSQVIILQLIDKAGQASAGEVSEAARLSQPTVSAILDRLEEGRLITRKRDTGDKRRVALELSAKGKRFLQDLPDVLQNRFESRFESLADWEQAGLVAALERLVLLLDAAALDAAPILDVGRLDRSGRET